MDLKWPWLGLGLALLVLAALALFVLWRWDRRPERPDPYRLAHSERVKRLPRFRALVRRQVLLAHWLTAAVLVTAAGAVLLAARPQATTVSSESQANRDVVLCLDASSSMYDEDVEVLDAYREIAEDLDGERLGLMIWSEAAVTVFPLTDDQEFIQDQLRSAQEAMAMQDPSFVEGTYLGTRASAIGDGLVSCVDMFDHEDTDRGKAIILASDNDPQGEPPLFSLDEAAEYAVDKKVRVYGIGSPDLLQSRFAANEKEFADAVEKAGGTFAILGEDGSSSQIADDIRDIEATRLEQPPEITVQERTTVPTVVTGIGVLMLLVGWGFALAQRLAGRSR